MPEMTEERIAELRRLSVNNPLYPNWGWVGECLDEIERLRAAVDACRAVVSDVLDENGQLRSRVAELEERLEITVATLETQLETERERKR